MKRIQRKRTKGWRMPQGAIYVGRPTRWGNPYNLGRRLPFWPFDPAGPRDIVELFRLTIPVRLANDPHWLTPLRGHDLVCWCPLDQPCHADVLLELAA